MLIIFKSIIINNNNEISERI